MSITPAFAGRQAHVHFIITGGGLFNNKWNKSSKRFILPDKAISIIFKAKFRDALKKADPVLFNKISVQTWKDDWVVKSIPVGSGYHALKYLAQYVFRVAISNSRIISCKNGTVTFKYKESQTNQWKIMNLGTDEFIRRFLQHVLPSGFVKVRYYGLFASANRGALSMVRMLFECNDTVKKKKTNNAGLFKCPVCKKEMIVVILIPRPVRRSFNEVGPSRRFNKAPPQLNISFDNLSFNRCA